MRGKSDRTNSFSRRLRHNATEAEKRVWGGLRDRRCGGYKFVRQDPIGPYTVDFCCREVKLVVEIDGSQHADSARDERRDAWLASEGYTVIRFWNNDAIARTSAVIEAILLHLQGRMPREAAAPHPNPLPASGARELRTDGGEPLREAAGNEGE